MFASYQDNVFGKLSGSYPAKCPFLAESDPKNHVV